MPFRVESTQLADVVVLLPRAYEDERGYFMEAFHAGHFRSLGLPDHFPQDNQSRSRRGVIRGLHFQWDPPMGKLMRVTSGAAFLIAVDIRKGSPTLGKWVGIEASAENRKQVWAPAGFARGFAVLSDYAEVLYKCTGTYNHAAESGIRWDDPQIGISWPVSSPVLSEKDRNAPTLAQWLASDNSDHFKY
jgi:dTDP-4-dehydrorhamnose 3,5-epimerase